MKSPQRNLMFHEPIETPDVQNNMFRLQNSLDSAEMFEWKLPPPSTMRVWSAWKSVDWVKQLMPALDLDRGSEFSVQNPK